MPLQIIKAISSRDSLYFRHYDKMTNHCMNIKMRYNRIFDIRYFDAFARRTVRNFSFQDLQTFF